MTQKNIEAIRYFMENGGAFTVNTGRSVPFSREIMEKIPMNAAFLGYNGSLAMENGEPLFFYEIDLPLEETLYRICREFPGYRSSSSSPGIPSRLPLPA